MKSSKNLKIGKKNPNLLRKYREKVVPEMMKMFAYKSSMAVPALKKITINTGIGKWGENANQLESIKQDLAKITGQQPVFTLAKKAISGFKVRQGQKVGLKVTLRKSKMYEFLERLIVATLPRVKDFRGISEKNFGPHGTVDFGIREHIAFPEIDSENTDYLFSLQINITTSSNNKQESLSLMKLLGLPVTDKSLPKPYKEVIETKKVKK